MIGKLMKLVYLADTQIPSRATNGMQIMRMCAAFAAHGADVTLVHPHRFGNRPEGYFGDVWAFYGVPEKFRLVTLPTPLTLKLSSFEQFARVARGVPLSAWILGRSRPGAQPFVAYSRSMLGAWLAMRARRFWGSRSACRGIYIELHDAPRTSDAWKTIADADGVVAISEALRHHVSSRQPNLAGRMFVEHDGVDGRLLTGVPLGREMARRKLAIDGHATVVGYTGRVTTHKGVDTLLLAAKLLQAEPFRFLLVGKVYGDIDPHEAQRLANITLTGFVPPPEVPSYVAASDILVMPTSATLSYSQFTSPLKLFEYMASNRPVICSDLPVLREVMTHERNALLFRPDDAASLTDAITRLRGEPELARSLAEQASRDVIHHTWENRAKRILSEIAMRVR